MIVQKKSARFSGTGDLFASLVLAYSTQQPKADLGAVVERTVNAVQHVIYETLANPKSHSLNPHADKFVELRLLQCGDYIRAAAPPKFYTRAQHWRSAISHDTAKGSPTLAASST